MKKLLSFVLSIAVTVSMIPADVYAEEDPPEEPQYYILEMNDSVLTAVYGKTGEPVAEICLAITETEEGPAVVPPSSEEDFTVWCFDEEGKASPAKTGAMHISFEEDEPVLCLVMDGKICRPEEDCQILMDGTAYVNHVDGTLTACEKGEYVIFEDVLYVVADESGLVKAFTGIRDGIYHEEGVIPEKDAAYVIQWDGRMYLVQRNGSAGLLTGFYSGQYYSEGAASSMTGVAEGKYVRNGKIQKPASSMYIVMNSCLYAVDQEGNAKERTVKGKAYCVTAIAADGYRYIFQVEPSTAYAKKYVRSSKKKGYYQWRTLGVLYKVSYKTGRAYTYDGRYSGKYYKSGKVYRPSRTEYVKIGKYIYRIRTDGSCKIYKKSKRKKGSYSLTIGHYRYSVKYRTGKVSRTYNLSMSRAAYVACARKYLGVRDKKYGHKSILSIYNSYTPNPRGYAMRRYQPWCATFVSAMAIKTDCTNIIPVECSCYYQMRAFQKKGRWVEKDSYVPKPGDIIYYDWQARKKGDCKGFPDHVGIVEKVQNGKITVIEGNKSTKKSNIGICARRTIPVNYRYIRGFAVPAYKG